MFDETRENPQVPPPPVYYYPPQVPYYPPQEPPRSGATQFAAYGGGALAFVLTIIAVMVMVFCVCGALSVGDSITKVEQEWEKAGW